jgi:hypothetical protein
MTVNRKLLEQELARAGQITQSAVSGEGFDPRGGYGVLAAQLGTAAIGAFAQKRAKDKILAQEEQRNIALSKVTGLGLDLVSQLSDSSKQSAMDLALKSRFSQPKFDIRESDQGFVRINAQTGTAEPIMTNGEQLKSKVKKPLVEVKTGDLESSFEKESGKNKAARFNSILEAGDKSFAFDRNLDAIEVAMDEGAFLGAGASKFVAINEFAAAVGLPADLDKASNTRVIEQRLNDLTLQATGKLKGAISEKELDLAKKTIFKLGTSEIATRKAIRTLRSLSKYDQGLSGLANQAEQDGTFTTTFRKQKRVYDQKFRKSFMDELRTPVKTQKQSGNINQSATPLLPSGVSQSDIQAEIERRKLK